MKHEYGQRKISKFRKGKSRYISGITARYHNMAVMHAKKIEDMSRFEEEEKKILTDLNEDEEPNPEEYEIKPDDNIEMNETISDYLHAISVYKVLSREEEHDLMVRVKKGDTEAKEQMMLHNLKLVVSIAKKYAVAGHNMDMMDLIQEGNIGLDKAIRLFDEESGHKFSTYATWWIKQAIMRAIAEKEKIVRLPVHINDKLRAINVAYAKLSAKGMGKVTSEDIDRYLGKPIGYTQKMREHETITVSYDMPIGTEEHESSTLSDFLPDYNQNVEMEAMTAYRSEIIENVLKKKLTDKECQIIKMRFGYYNGKVMTLEEVGTQFHVTRERIRQIEEKALKKLRNGMSAQVLRDLLQ